MADSKDFPRNYLRHLVATIAYRGTKTMREAPSAFATLRVSPTSRTPLEILSHVGDTLAWARTMVEGKQSWNSNDPGSWSSESDRFHENLRRLDLALTAAPDLSDLTDRLVQGPLADMLTHIGQLAMLRRVAGSPVKGENYFRADVVAGRVGPEQQEPKREFD